MPTQPLNIVVLVSGRGTNLQALIHATQRGIIKSSIKRVVSNNPDAPALIRARDAGIPCTVVPSAGRSSETFQDELLKTVQSQGPDLIVLAGFMKILSPQFVRAFHGKIINIHPALLPDFPGLNAQKQALDAGVKITGCTVHFVDEGCDTGPIILQKAEEIKNDDTLESLSQRLLKKEHRALVDAVKLLENGKVVLQGRKTLIRNET